MFVTTAMTGARRRNEPSLSSASATRNGHPAVRRCARLPRPRPARALGARAPVVPGARADHATDHDGRVRPAAWTCAISEVVVVLPCVPATAMPS
jgi:hypothetical protein